MNDNYRYGTQNYKKQECSVDVEVVCKWSPLIWGLNLRGGMGSVVRVKEKSSVVFMEGTFFYSNRNYIQFSGVQMVQECGAELTLLG